MYDNELYHFGVKGMRWGIRRKTGQSESSVGSTKKSRMSEDAALAKSIKKKKVKDMSNAELKKLNERQQLERTHKQLNKSTVAKGVAFMAAAAGTMNTALNLYNNSDKLITHGKNFADRFYNRG